MKTILFYFLLIRSLIVFADEMQVAITQEQIEKLDIQIGSLNSSYQIPLLAAPAKVVVPANHERLVSSPQPGLIVQLQANIGDSVQKGQVLAIINSPSLVGLENEFLSAEKQLSLSELEFKRDKTLQQEGVIAARRWQETQTLHGIKSAQLHTARQLLSMAGLSTAEINQLSISGKLSSELNIPAPINGVVLERYATLGSRLDIQAPLYLIADLSELWLEINIPQEKMHAVHIGDLVQIEKSAITAKISLLGQSVNPENQTVLARAIVDGKHNELRVGQNINVQILQKSEQPVFKVNNSAIAQYEGHNYVFVRNPNGFTVLEIKIIGKQDAESLFSAALSGSEQIAIKGGAALKANWLKLGDSK